MQRRPRVAIAGAGIAGLSTAAALSGLGFEVSLFEAEPRARIEGGALGIAPNGLAVLEKLGLGDEIRRASRSVRNGIVSDERLNRLMSFPPGAFGVALHRSDLLAILHGAAKHAALKYDKRLADCSTDDKCVGLTFADGSTFEADYLLGCDGIHSVARAKVASETKVRFVGESYWAGVSNHSVHDWDFCEAWGPGLRFGMVGLDGGRTYWFASRKSELRDTRAPIDRAEIEALYHRFSAKVHAILRATPVETIFLANSLDLDPPDGPWFDGRICLMGDAAHATTPNLAQGANQAMEDA
jgi:2-polyprenyl-6-methoxyphenol hydroxylase-like FAD-dependent oxidoreductase